MDHEKLLYTQVEAAQALGISPRSVEHLMRTGRLERRKIGRRVLITASSLRRFAGSDQPGLGIPFGGHAGASANVA